MLRPLAINDAGQMCSHLGDYVFLCVKGLKDRVRPLNIPVETPTRAAIRWSNLPRVVRGKRFNLVPEEFLVRDLS